MGIGQGINAVLHAALETTYGVTPASGFLKLPFVSHSMGEERPLIEDDQLGLGREGGDPVYDVAINVGDIVVPVDISAFGFWLKAMFGYPTTTGTGPYTHKFYSGGADAIPFSIDIGNPEVPSYSVHYGAVANQLRIALSRQGMLNATVSMIAQGESAKVAASVAGTPSLLKGRRFAQATGVIRRDGVALGNIASADLSISNGIQTLDVIRGDGRIGGAELGVVQAALRITAYFNSLDLLDAATDGTPVNLDNIGWTNGTNRLEFSLPRVFLPRVKNPITGPGPIMADFNCQAAAPDAARKVGVTLINGVASYT